MTSRLSKVLLGSLLALILSLVSGITQASPIFAQDTNQLSSDIDEFFSKGAQGYLVWQYSGDSPQSGGQYFENDPYSFFRNGSTEDEAVCQLLQEKGAQYNSNPIGIGVNIWSLGDPRYSPDVVADHLAWLKANCGVKTIRIFAKAGEVAGVQKVVSTAEATGVQVIVAIGDYSNGGGRVPAGAGRSWYESGYQTEYLPFANAIRDAVGTSGAVFAFELANEPHCGGDASAIGAYTAWGKLVGGLLGISGKQVGYGQMASQNTTRCDSPGPGDFQTTNGIPEITITSAHYYSSGEKANALLALEQSKTLGKLFYIGEAPPGKVSDSGYTTTPFPTYDADTNEYFLHPICIDGEECRAGYNNQGVGSIKRNLINQGYQVQCANNDMFTRMSKSGDWERYLALFANANERLRVESTQVIDYSNAKIPNFRDLEGDRWRMTSIEEFFGFRDIYTNQDTLSLLNSSPLEKLMSEEQRCNAAFEVLEDSENLCQLAINNGSPEALNDCALNTEIPDPANTLSGLKKFDLLQQVSGLTCKEIVSQDTTLKKAVLSTPLYLERAYRWAFLVVVVQLRPEVQDQLFNFFTHNPTDENKHEVQVVAFKVPDVALDSYSPDIGPDSQTPDRYSDLRYDDPIEMTRDSLLTETEQDRVEEIRKQEKLKLYTYSNDNDKEDIMPGDPVNEIIQTAGGPQLISCEHNSVCGDREGRQGDPLTRALVDIINSQREFSANPENRNGNGRICEDEDMILTSEIAQEILDQANLTDADTWQYVGNLGNNNLIQPLGRNTTGDGTQNPQLSSFPPFVTNFVLPALDHSDGQSRTFAYLVYPGDYDLQTSTDAMRAPFFTSEQIERMERDRNEHPDSPIPTKYGFKIVDSIVSFTGGQATKRFPDPEACRRETDPGPPPVTRDICDERSFSLQIYALQEAAQIPGATLGFWMKEMQKSLSSAASTHHAYLMTCNNTEEFLLGTCGAPLAPRTIPTVGTQPPNPNGCGVGYPITVDNLSPPYSAVSPLPISGKAMYYANGVMDKVEANRRAWGEITECPECIGRVALLRDGDMDRRIWMQRPGHPVEGPFWVIDVAAAHDIPCLLERSWVVDVDWETAVRWGMQGPIDVTVLANP